MCDSKTDTNDYLDSSIIIVISLFYVYFLYIQPYYTLTLTRVIQFILGTTRPPRPGELNGIDYTFVTQAEFFKLEANGSLLESGLFEGKH